MQYNLLDTKFKNGQVSHTYGAFVPPLLPSPASPRSAPSDSCSLLLASNRLDPVQVTQMAKHLETVYVSGWQSSSTASSTNEPGPDLAGPSFPLLASLTHFRTNADCRLTWLVLDRLPLQHGSQQGRAPLPGAAVPRSVRQIPCPLSRDTVLRQLTILASLTFVLEQKAATCSTQVDRG